MSTLEEKAGKYQELLLQKITTNIEKFKEKTIINIVTSRAMLANIDKLKEEGFKNDCFFLKHKLEKTLRLYLAARLLELRMSNLILKNVRNIKGK